MTPAARIRPLRLLGLAAAAMVLAGCAATSQAADPSPVGAPSTVSPAPTNAGPSPTSAAAPTPSATLPPTWGTGPQAPADPNGAGPAVSWTPESRAAATTVAVNFMGAYARPKTPQPGWSNALAPYASLDLRGVLASVDTTYLATGSPAPNGTLQASAGDPYNAIVLVGTSDGPWQLTVHRQPDASWLVAAIQPPAKQATEPPRALTRPPGPQNALPMPPLRPRAQLTYSKGARTMEPLTDRARSVSLKILDALPRRRAHVAGVAAAAAASARGFGLSYADAEAVVAASWLHDIGYAASIADTGFHPVDGAAHAHRAGFPATVVSLIAHHTGAPFEAQERGLTAELAVFARPEEGLLDLITYADLTTSPAGEPVDARDRIAEILSRYPEEHPVNRAVSRSAPHLLAAVDRVQDRHHSLGAGGQGR